MHLHAAHRACDIAVVRRCPCSCGRRTRARSTALTSKCTRPSWPSYVGASRPASSRQSIHSTRRQSSAPTTRSRRMATLCADLRRCSPTRCRGRLPHRHFHSTTALARRHRRPPALPNQAGARGQARRPKVCWLLAARWPRCRSQGTTGAHVTTSTSTNAASRWS